ncbi:MAG: nickel-dependent hydrogenase large subunit [Pseudomonadota bacterium]
MTRHIVGPFSRVEGDLEVQLDINDNQVTDAKVVSQLYRGFEKILQGKDPNDALVYVPRICGICSVSQSIAAAQALADIQGLKMPHNGELASNLILANENVADHLTHFYLFFMPDFARDFYQKKSWFNAAEKRFKAITGTALKPALAARTEFMHLMGLLAGKWPHSLALQAGGVSCAIGMQEKLRIIAILSGFRQFLEQTLFADSLENIISLDSEVALYNWSEQQQVSGSDFRHFLFIAEDLKLQDLGKTTGNFMSYGVYPSYGQRLFTPGVWMGSVEKLDQAKITEDVSSSWMFQQNGAKHPYEGLTQPSIEQPDAYSWCKSPRLDGEVMEVGALARQIINGHPLVQDLIRNSGSNVRNRVIARLLELAIVVVEMEDWAREIQPKEPFCNHAAMPDEAQAYGMIEAARGSLGHWVKIKKGRILNYQIIAPTTWNFSPRDAQGNRGPLEQALLNTQVTNNDHKSVAVQHIVRSFDPCMACTVH